MEKFSVAIIAGGVSRRYGSDKTLALLENRPLIGWVANGAAKISDDVMVIAKATMKYSFLHNVRFLADVYDQQCALVGLLTAFRHATYDKVFMISADMPAFPFEAVNRMNERSVFSHTVVPNINGKYYPCAALYNKKDQDVFQDLYDSGNFKLIDAFERIMVLEINEEAFAPYDPLKIGFININTPADLEKLIELKNKEIS